MALDSDAEDASPTTALKEFEADICFLHFPGFGRCLRHFQYHGVEPTN